MLKHTQTLQTSASTTPVFHLTELHTEPASITVTSLPPDAEPLNERQRGMLAGEAALHHALAEAAQRKGTHLTKGEILEQYGTCWKKGVNARKRDETSHEWNEGWWRGLALACLDAERAAADQPVGQALPHESAKADVPVIFRKATLLVRNPGEFFDGITWGQIAQVEDTEPLTVTHLFQELARELVTLTYENETADWLLGYLLGRTDALLRDRQTYPRGQ